MSTGGRDGIRVPVMVESGPRPFTRAGFTQGVMGFGVPAAIGLGGMPALGPALNIGFASMSGGPVGASIAAFSFAVGGTARAFIRLNRELSKFQDTLEKAAVAAGFTTDLFRENRADREAFRVFQGGLAAFVKENNIGRFNQLLRDNLGTLTDLNLSYANIRDTLKFGFISAGIRALGGSADTATLLGPMAVGSALGGGLGGFLGLGFGRDIINLTRSQRRTMGPALQEMLDNMQRGDFRPSFLSPEQFHRRTQLRLLGGNRDQEQRRLIISELQELIALSKEANQIEINRDRKAEMTALPRGLSAGFSAGPRGALGILGGLLE